MRQFEPSFLFTFLTFIRKTWQPFTRNIFPIPFRHPLNVLTFKVISVYDLDPEESFHAVVRFRKGVGRQLPGRDDLKESMSLVGGRLSYLNKIARSKDMVSMARHLLEVEKGWLLSQIGGHKRSSLIRR